MKRFTAQLNDGSYMNIRADRMEITENAIVVYFDGNLVAYLDTGCVLTAHLSEKVNPA